MAREDSIIRGLLNKGRVVRDVEEPWWSKRYGDLLGKVPDVIEGFKGRKKEKAVAEQEIADANQQVLNKAPLGIYIG